jgi:hypothetical protein
MIRPKVACLTVVSLFACVGCQAFAQTGYHPRSDAEGYAERKLEEPASYEVTFSGNSYTTAERASAFALLRAAEVCLGDGFRYFVVRTGGTDARPVRTIRVRCSRDPGTDPSTVDVVDVLSRVRDEYALR